MCLVAGWPIRAHLCIEVGERRPTQTVGRAPAQAASTAPEAAGGSQTWHSRG